MGATLVIPERSLQQRMDALERANAIRSYRAELKRDVKAGRTSAAVLLLSNDPRLHTWKVFDLMLAVPRIGRVKANKILRDEGVSPSKTIGGITDRQRMALATALGGIILG